MSKHIRLQSVQLPHQLAADQLGGLSLRGYPARLLTHSAIHAPASAPAAASASIQPCEDESCAL